MRIAFFFVLFFYSELANTELRTRETKSKSLGKRFTKKVQKTKQKKGRVFKDTHGRGETCPGLFIVFRLTFIWRECLEPKWAIFGLIKFICYICSLAPAVCLG